MQKDLRSPKWIVVLKLRYQFSSMFSFVSCCLRIGKHEIKPPFSLWNSLLKKNTKFLITSNCIDTVLVSRHISQFGVHLGTLHIRRKLFWNIYSQWSRNSQFPILTNSRWTLLPKIVQVFKLHRKFKPWYSSTNSISSSYQNTLGFTFRDFPYLNYFILTRLTFRTLSLRYFEIAAILFWISNTLLARTIISSG
jgi:hypothetical protein